jgi:hypothetical protein
MNNDIEERYNAFHKWYNFFMQHKTSDEEIELSLSLDKKLPKFINNLNNENNLESLILNNLKNNIKTISNERLSKYRFEYLRTSREEETGREIFWGGYKKYLSNESEYIVYDIYLDTPFGIGLIYENKLNSIISFIPEYTNTLLINQIQGVRPNYINLEKKQIKKMSSRGLVVLDWEKLMIELVTKFAKENNFKKIGIQSTLNNHWVNSYKYRLEKARERYDNTAKRLGFNQDENNFYKKIE